MKQKLAQLFRGNLVHTPSKGELEILTDVYCGVDEQGKIAFISPINSEGWREEFDAQGAMEIDVGKNRFLMPGFVDLHFHAPQYPFHGTATDTSLMQWLQKYIFPTEARYGKDLAFATSVYRRMVNHLLRLGTTTALFYATIDVEPSLVLCDEIESAGMRGFVGIPSLDRNGSAEHGYERSTAQAIEDAQRFIDTVLARHKPRDLVHPVVTPRFLPTCSPELLTALSNLAHQHNLLIQSHISESRDEVESVQKLYGEPDAKVFERMNMMGPRTVMAHATRMTRDDWNIVKSKGVGIAHCPLSNAFFGDGAVSVKRLWRENIKVGLGTDVAGGYTPAMLSAIRQAVVTSKMMEAQRKDSIDKHGVQKNWSDEPLDMDWVSGLYLATLGGAEVLGMADKIGTLAVGKSLDAIVVEVLPFNGQFRPPFEVFPTDTMRDRVEKFVNLGDDRNIKQVFVGGKCVFSCE
ncbi:uncharacterized protein VTP21DRAFT_1578 [Calcarisporiella thermophila]|uniref:uncharacterized protein n=1 Tax=Calcarisporiella thermophila TaxID=911321 RepID=UPI0037423753